MKKKVSRAQAIRVYLRAKPDDKTKRVRDEVEKLGYGRPSDSEVSKARKQTATAVPKLKKKTGLDLTSPKEVDAAIAFVNSCGSFKKAIKVLRFTRRIRASIDHRLNC